jgi:hypothetical protein
MYAANGTPESEFISGARSVATLTPGFGYLPSGLPNNALNAASFCLAQETWVAE